MSFAPRFHTIAIGSNTTSQTGKITPTMTQNGISGFQPLLEVRFPSLSGSVGMMT